MLSAYAIVGDAVYRYDDEGEPAYTMSERVLLAMRRGRWMAAREILAMLAIDDAQGRDANAVAATLKRAVGAARMERRGANRKNYEYRLRIEAFAPVAVVAAPRARCVWCVNAPRPGRATCESCAAKHAVSNKRWAEKQKAMR